MYAGLCGLPALSPLLVSHPRPVMCCVLCWSCHNVYHSHRVTAEGIACLSSLNLHSLSWGYTSMPEADEVAALIGQQFTALTGGLAGGGDRDVPCGVLSAGACAAHFKASCCFARPAVVCGSVAAVTLTRCTIVCMCICVPQPWTSCHQSSQTQACMPSGASCKTSGCSTCIKLQ